MKPIVSFCLGLALGIMAMAWLSQRQVAPLRAENADLRALKERDMTRQSVIAEASSKMRQHLDAIPTERKLRVQMNSALRQRRPLGDDDVEKGDGDHAPA